MPAAIVAESGGGPGPRGIGPVDDGLLRQPLEYLFVDHLRQRDLCTLVEHIAEASALDGRLAGIVLDHASGALAVHGLDDEEDLHPLLRRRASPEDKVEDVLGALSGEHALEERLVAGMVAGLGAAIGTGRVDEPLRETLRAFATHLRRRLTVENALVLPLAELRLTEADLRGLARRMAARRGLRLRGGASDV